MRVVIAEPRRLIAEALAALLGADRGCAVTTVDPRDRTAPAVILRHAPDIALIGVGAQPAPAFDLARRLRRAGSDSAIVIVADALARELVSFVVDNGLSGIVLTDAPAQDIVACLDQVAHGHAVLPTGWHRALSAESDDPVAALSERQLEVLELLADGHSYDEIGTRLFITHNTVKFHVRSIFERLGVRNRMAAARLLARHHTGPSRPYHSAVHPATHPDGE